MTRNAIALTMVLAAAALGAQTPAPLAALDGLETALAAAPDDLRAGNDYRIGILEAARGDKTTAKYDRAIATFERLAAARPDAGNLHLNHGFAYVDKIPAAGAITQVILASRALDQFSKSLAVSPTWIGLYTRGNSYLFWPVIFGRTKLGLADLEQALQLQRTGPKRPYHVRTFVALGDGHWMLGDLTKATETWRAGLQQFPDNAALRVRLDRNGDALKKVIDDAYDPNKRVDTNLQELW